MPREVRLERLLAQEVREAMAAAPVAWVPLGALEFHAEHLPFGTDGFSAQQVCEHAAQRAGGVVLPWSALTMGTLHLEWTLRYDAALVAESVRQTILQLADHGARVVVVHTGHGPLDLAHLIKRVCAEVEASPHTPADFRAYGLCYLELNAAQGAGLDSAWPVAIDHGSIVETSWVMAMEPELVDLERLPADPDAAGMLGVYGPNPRHRASAELGRQQLEGCADLLATRVQTLLDGGTVDALADLRVFVERYWPEPLALEGRSGSAGAASLSLSNPGPVSRYLTGLTVAIDDDTVDPAATTLSNRTPGEAGTPVVAAALGREAGFYVRRGQSATIDLPLAVSPGRHHVAVTLGLAGVVETSLVDEVGFA
jgi:creatinine amidohydrolase